MNICQGTQVHSLARRACIGTPRDFIFSQLLQGRIANPLQSVQLQNLRVGLVLSDQKFLRRCSSPPSQDYGLLEKDDSELRPIQLPITQLLHFTNGLLETDEKRP